MWHGASWKIFRGHCPKPSVFRQVPVIILQRRGPVHGAHENERLSREIAVRYLSQDARARDSEEKNRVRANRMADLG